MVSANTKQCYIVDLSYVVGKAHPELPMRLYQLLYTDLSDEHFVVVVARSRPHPACAACTTPVRATLTVTEQRRLLLAPRTNATTFAVAYEAARLHHLLPRSARMHVVSTDAGAACLLQPLQQLGRKVDLYRPEEVSLASLPLPELAVNQAAQNIKPGQQTPDLIRDLETVMPRVYKWLENASINGPEGLPANLAGLLRMVAPMCAIREPANVQHMLHIILSRNYASVCSVCAAFRYSDAFLRRELPAPDSTATVYDKKMHAVLLQLQATLAHHPKPPSTIEEMAQMVGTYVYKSRVDPAQVVSVLVADQLVEVAPDNHVAFKTVRPPLIKKRAP